MIIKQYGKINLCNLTDGGEGISGHTFIMSQEGKDKISAALKDKPKTKEHIDAIKSAKKDNPNNTTYWKDKTFNEKHKDKLSISAQNKPPMSNETKALISKNSKAGELRKGKTYEEIYGKEEADRLKELNRIAHIGKTHTPKSIEKMRKFGDKHSKSKIYITNNNGIITEEKTTIQDLSKKFNLDVYRIRTMIYKNKIINNISIKIKENETR